MISLRDDGGRSVVPPEEAMASSWTCDVLPRAAFTMVKMPKEVVLESDLAKIFRL